MKSLLLVVLLCYSSVLYSSSEFRPKSGEVAYLWPDIPFFALGDLGQYEDTLSAGRDRKRHQFFDSLIDAVERLGQLNGAPELMIEPIANILLLFDQVYDHQKNQDQVAVNQSLSVQLIAHIDTLYRQYKIAEKDQILSFNVNKVTPQLKSQIKKANLTLSFGEQAISSYFYKNKQAWQSWLEPVQYSAYGTFSSLGRGLFQVTLHISNLKTGAMKSFTVNTSIKEASKDLAYLVYEYFQRQAFPDWQVIHSDLSWLPAPYRHSNREGFLASEAVAYCQSRGYRLPYARELMLADTGTQYQAGGVGPLKYGHAYPVKDHRLVISQYAYTPGTELATGGPVQVVLSGSRLSDFWCVKGRRNEDVIFIEEIWRLIRIHREVAEVYQALETLRFFMGDFGIGPSVRLWPSYKEVSFLSTPMEAQEVLGKFQIRINLPRSLVTNYRSFLLGR